MYGPDVLVLTWVAEHRTGWATRVSSLLMSAASSWPVIGVFVALVLLFVAVRWWWAPALVVGSAAVAAFVVTGVLKTVIGRPRPPAALALVQPGGFSMPSTDGALTAAAALGVLLVTMWPTRTARRAATAGLSLLVVLVGAALIYLGAHWPSDVLAGWSVGAVAAWSCHCANAWLRRRLAGVPVTDGPAEVHRIGPMSSQ